MPIFPSGKNNRTGYGKLVCFKVAVDEEEEVGEVLDVEQAIAETTKDEIEEEAADKAEAPEMEVKLFGMRAVDQT